MIILVLRSYSAENKDFPVRLDYACSKPVTVAERSKACTVFAHSEPGIVRSNPT
jgi:hypothetical protein